MLRILYIQRTLFSQIEKSVGFIYPMGW